MQFPVYINFLSLHLPLHAATETLGMFIGFRYFLYLRRKQGDYINNNNRIWIIIGAIFGALAGSRLLGALENPPAFFHASNPLLYFYLNKTIVGGLLGGLIGVELMKKALILGGFLLIIFFFAAIACFIAEKRDAGKALLLSAGIILLVGLSTCGIMLGMN